MGMKPEWSCCARTSNQRSRPWTPTAQASASAAKNRTRDGGLKAFMERRHRAQAALLDLEKKFLSGRSTIWILLLCMEKLLAIPRCTSFICFVFQYVRTLFALIATANSKKKELNPVWTYIIVIKAVGLLPGEA